MNNFVWLAPFLMSFVLFVLWPATTLIPVAFFLYVSYRDKNKQSLIAGSLWILYGLWELGMRERVLCTGECNIRVDLLLIMWLLDRVSRKALGFL